MIDDIMNNKVYTAYNTLVKNGIIGTYRLIMNENKQILMEREMFSKNWILNTARSAEATILLDLVKTVFKKLYNITSGNL